MRMVVSDPYGSVYDLLSQDKFTVCLSQGKSRKELRMVLVKPRRREGSVSERLCNVWLDDARDELVIVYETVKKLCIGSHVSNEGGHFPYPEFVDNGGDDDNGDDNPLSNSVPVKLGAGGTSKVDGAAGKLKKARKA
ncbi:hypothetical protein Bca52824_074828 [Brassica carinata]|uniref:Uncharacterized protein n=1 Tax=Brassica carinata TaxID=52824 RepID=A0A8X7PTV7_BRACI|nr:hypothetical protein Bca52824_074828 [Brassica carinata]